MRPAGVAADITPSARPGIAATPGCAFFTVTPDRGDDDQQRGPTTTGSTSSGRHRLHPARPVHSFRVYYRLQVSPAPAVATFPNDVPTSHPFFRFVEAMAASGLTGGCGPG